MKLYIMCPICVTRIGKAQETKELEVHCRCGTDLLIDTKESTLKVEMLTAPEKPVRTQAKPQPAC